MVAATTAERKAARMAKKPKDHVKQHLRKNGVDPDTLPDGVIDALNTFSDAELAKVDNLGAQLQAAPLSPATKISAVH
jgi:hypothetical protein